MRVEIIKGDQTQWIKEDRLTRFLEQGWQLVAEPAPKKVSKGSKEKVVAHADVITEEYTQEDADWEAPLISLPTDNH